MAANETTRLVIHKIKHRASDELLKTISQQLGAIMATQAELAAAITAVSTQLSKALTELTTAIANAGNSTPETDAAVAGLQAAAQALDDVVPDA